MSRYKIVKVSNNIEIDIKQGTSFGSEILHSNLKVPIKKGITTLSCVILVLINKNNIKFES